MSLDGWKKSEVQPVSAKRSAMSMKRQNVRISGGTVSEHGCEQTTIKNGKATAEAITESPGKASGDVQAFLCALFPPSGMSYCCIFIADPRSCKDPHPIVSAVPR
jgi:hypothetical protein